MTIKKVLMILTIISIVLFVVFFVNDMVNVEHQKEQNQRINQTSLPPGQTPPRPEDQIIKIPLYAALLTIALMLVGFFFTYSYTEQTYKRKLSVVTSIAGDARQNDSATPYTDIDKTIINLLSPQERQIVKQIVENHGVCLQSDISRLNNMGKVKAHRYLQNLLKMGVVKIEPYGNTNKITLSENVKKIFIK